MQRLLLPILVVAATSSAAMAEDRLVVELNKLEPGAEGGCQAYFLFRNSTAYDLDPFEMSLAAISRWTSACPKTPR